MSKKIVVLRNDENFTYYKIPAGKAGECETYDNQWETFDEFKKQYFSSWEVALPLDKASWKIGTCNCRQFKMNMCKHVIALAIRLKYVVPPLEAKNIPLVKKEREVALLKPSVHLLYSIVYYAPRE
jgi:hypothetical protein